METEKQFNFQIKGIEIVENSIVAPKNRIDNNTVFGFDLQLNQSFNLDRELVIVTCVINVSDNDTKDKLGHIKASCLYSVEKLEKYIDKEKSTTTLPDDVTVMLNSISISTVRGVMYGMFRGTFLNGAILPVVNPSKPADKKK
ncbi:hypothetical protein JBL43_01650 [Aureibaculum sp. A20]|uniref:Preprotein translocase subunit SecB n=1 Tax=Aureibaculum flavum TaxID=2795986 RepID=A0ABS0WLS4_9FLAO|nr:hypothetical protein [Aureibaculum flavum]MBJ2172922.1 hypothetical protein [Aureibaculum flavum]